MGIKYGKEFGGTWGFLEDLRKGHVVEMDCG